MFQSSVACQGRREGVVLHTQQSLLFKQPVVQYITLRTFLYLAITITKRLEKRLDGMHTHTTNAGHLYVSLPKLTQKITQRRLRLAGHCVRHPEEAASNLVLGQPSHGGTSIGRPAINFIDTLLKDTGLSSTTEIRNVMLDRKIWREYVSLVRLKNRPK